MADDLAELTVVDVAAWREWLRRHHTARTGVWLVLAKSGVTEPTELVHEQALEEALCWGWIDGQLQRRDESTYRQRFTPRSPTSAWSRRNVAIAERLIGAARMRPAGLAAIERARSDGGWDSAYAGQASIEVPADLAAALALKPAALLMFDRLSSQNRYAILYRIGTARRGDTRARRIERFVTMLERGETLHPH